MLSFLIQFTGYLATLFLAVSLVITNDLKFRWINAAGCFTFMIYGILLQAYPIIITNALLFGINVYYLIKVYRTYEDFDLIEFKGDERLVYKFLGFYDTDIKSYFPHYVHAQNDHPLNFVVLRDLVIANIFVAEIRPDGTAVVKLNYTTPKYRDYKIGRFVFDKKKEFLISKGIKKVVYNEVAKKSHEKFLKVSGFKKSIFEGKESYIKEL
jgi:hypothetical protein